MPTARKEDGAVLVEFALVLPFLLLAIFGFLFIGLATNAKIDSTHLTAEGARYITVNQNPALTVPDTACEATGVQTMQRYIKCRGDTVDLRTNAEVCIAYPVDSVGKVGDPVRVRMRYYAPLIPLLASLGSGSPAKIKVTSEATMRLEAVPTSVPAGCIP